MTACLRRHEAHDRLDQLVDAHHLERGLLPAQKATQLGDDVTGAANVVDNVLECGTGFGEVGARRIQEP
jgi:hypothetical protein